MSKPNILIICILTLLSTIPVIVIGATQNQSQDIGSQMVGEGMKYFTYSIGDSMISMGTDDKNVSRTETPSLIFKMITFTVNPYKFEWVKDWWNTMLVFYVFVFILACMGGAVMVLLQKMSPDTVNRIAWIMGDQIEMANIRGWLSRMIIGLCFPFFVLFGVWAILQVNYAVSGMLTASVLNAVPPITDNIIAYLFMALAYLILSVIFALRSIIIVLFAAGSLGVAALYLIPQLQELVKSILVYFIIVVFMQPAMIFTAAVGTIFIKNLPPELSMFYGVSYLGLFILLMAIGLVCIIGGSVVTKIVGASMGRRI